MIGPILLRGDIPALNARLQADPTLADQAVAQGDHPTHRVHPIHLVCDGVFEKKISEKTALEMVRLLAEAGSDLNDQNSGSTTADTPLITAASLYCDDIALYLIDRGVDVSFRGTHRGTALHWAAWTGSAKVVKRLLAEEVAIDDQGDEFRSTPLLWAINGWLHANPANRREQPAVMELLLKAGANPNVIDGSGRKALGILDGKEQSGLVALLRKFGAE
ncbi:ankyrin repeat domain-containing protein [Flavilitoribacter nigricans]|uniref:Uncharacterized protein n=1 Tax=Flavilitoribacter nigricans (strain ATCC 23147 / DSM 23189 / NBRC 102662 / NCIMB 1420 / SS-2) TaxID=1122177 RepID=A0A2D0MZX6_FLAN2|nr:ankyrin repeat domain-containing protein [Flavilitoribacter nigricans]PHN01767.1 hypothetical protein CRP01_35360 [Flavilitoribacter nigricans DSM 23189 = NBRC 102662]